MKTLKSILFAGIMALLCMTSCSKETSDTEPARKVSANVTGQWHLIEELCEGIQVKDGADVYLYVNADCTFELYQKSGTQTRFTRYEGICYSDGDRLIGEYSDGTPWGAEYSVSFDGEHMILKSHDKLSIQRYEKKSMSEEDRNNADMAVKSASDIILPKL